jgi:hypothetical protein
MMPIVIASSMSLKIGRKLKPDITIKNCSEERRPSIMRIDKIAY